MQNSLWGILEEFVVHFELPFKISRFLVIFLWVLHFGLLEILERGFRQNAEVGLPLADLHQLLLHQLFKLPDS